MAGRSSIEVSGGGTGAFLPALKSLDLGYTPYPLIGWNRRMETIFASFFRTRPDVNLKRECLRTKDGGAVSLDWVVGDDRSLPEDSPVLILLPGLTGGSQDTYVRHMLVIARSNGWRVVVNGRGCGGSPVITPQVIGRYSWPESLEALLIELAKNKSQTLPQDDLLEEEEEMMEEEPVDIEEAVADATQENEDDKAYADELWSQVDSSQT